MQYPYSSKRAESSITGQYTRRRAGTGSYGPSPQMAQKHTSSHQRQGNPACSNRQTLSCPSICGCTPPTRGCSSQLPYLKRPRKQKLPKTNWLIAIATAFAVIGNSAANAETIPSQAFLALAENCAPSVAPEIISSMTTKLYVFERFLDSGWVPPIDAEVRPFTQRGYDEQD